MSVLNMESPDSNSYATSLAEGMNNPQNHVVLNSTSSGGNTSSINHRPIVQLQHSTPSSTNAAPIISHSTSSSLKRVSFGSSRGSFVETVVYEVASDCSESPSSRIDSPPTSSTSLQPDKVRVHFVEGEVPKSIEPPCSQQHSESVTLALNQSPVLPKLQKMADEAGDNPFRPDGNLSHEVDPIVDLYKKRPFPNSPSHPKDFMDGDEGDNPQQQLLLQQQSTNGAPPNNLPHGELMTKSQAVSVQQSAPPPSQRGGSSHKQQQQQQQPQQQTSTAEVQQRTLASPRANQVEVVHIEPKKRACNCCAVQ